MIYEIAELDIKEGQEVAFEDAFRQAVPLFQGAKGCHGAEIQRTVERPNVYRLVVQWETVEHHMVDLRESESFQEWRRLVGPHFASSPKVEHTSTAVKGF